MGGPWARCPTVELTHNHGTEADPAFWQGLTLVHFSA